MEQYVLKSLVKSHNGGLKQTKVLPVAFQSVIQFSPHIQKMPLAGA